MTRGITINCVEKLREMYVDYKLMRIQGETGVRLQEFATFLVKLQAETFNATYSQLEAINKALDACQTAIRESTKP
jgi:hypothetical protein